MAEGPQKLNCRGCGASLEYSPTDQALKCQYCGTLTDIPKTEEKAPSVSSAGSAIIPLKVNVTQLIDAVYEHLASGEATPDHLLEHATFTKKELFYVPAFGFKGQFEAQWTASFGYDRKEHYTDYVTRYENGKSHKEPVTKTKTVTDWRPVSGTDTGSFAVLAYAGDRLLKSPLNVVGLVEYIPTKEATAYDASFTTGVPVDEFAVTESEAYKNRASAQIDDVINRSVEKHGQGDRQRDWHWKASIDKKSMTVLVPICHAVYEFDGKQYNVWASGIDASTLIADPLPVDSSRQKATKRGFLPFSASVLASFGAISLGGSLGVSAVVVGIAALYGVLRKKAILEYSTKLRKSLLASRQAATKNTADLSPDEQKALAKNLSRPSKSWLANTAKDRVTIPIATLVVVAIPLLTSIGAKRPGEGEAVAQSQSQAVPATGEASQVAQPSAPVQPVTTAAVAPADAAASAASAASDGASQNTNADAGGVQQLAAIGNLLKLSKAGDWNAVDEQVAALKAQPVAVVKGDRRASRAANTEGLAALRANDIAAAVTAFERGAAADASDVEVRNNLGYALLKAQRLDYSFQVLGRLLLEVPDRSSAWANLAEAMASDAAMSTGALRLAVRFSSSREKTIAYLKQGADTHPSEQYRAVIAAVLADMDSIPRSPGDHSAPAAVQGTPVDQSQQSPAAPPPSTSDLDGAVRQMLADGSTCFAAKQFACAITNANNALRLRPNSADAQQLKSRAESAQAEAVQNIEIK